MKLAKIFRLTLLTLMIETFLLYANTVPLEGLGFIDSRASMLEIQLNGKDVTIHQSPGVLASSRKGGTTGAGQFFPPFTPPLSPPFSTISPLLFNPYQDPINLPQPK